jgi:hypothetical protein
MKKAFSLIIMIAILAVILGTIYIIGEVMAAKKRRQQPTSQTPDIIVIEKGDFKIVKNLTDGYQVTIPKEWNIEKPSVGYLSFDDINSVTPQNEFCKIEVNTIANLKGSSVEQWLNGDEAKTNESFLTIKLDRRDNITIDGQAGIKRVLDTAENGYSVAAIIAFDQKIYEFIIYPKGINAQKCLNSFDSYLSSIRFK